ncbi:MAG: MFS transporter [Alicyclobacillaceae bacterium]|uniref:MFS transporter n=1 Tax=Alicyclobacillus sp. SP_1 TaxID=2942475 RepID=UPI00215865ED|nr:MFS transporter [Alicyclobacillus sp. SP_1]MCY0887639.1 MFS transporter [Alicyclobacillaceae bacterium]
MVSLKKRLAYSSNQIGVNLLWQAFNTVAVFFYVTHLHVSATLISAGLIVYGIINAFLNLIAGHISDRTNLRMGRRIPYIVFGGLPLVVLFYLLFHPLVHSREALLYYFLIVTLLFDLCYTFVALNIGALFPEMYPSAKERSSVVALQQFFGIVGLILGVALSKSLGQSVGWSAMAILFAAITVITIYISLYGSFENPAYRKTSLRLREAVRETFRNKQFVYYVLASLFIQLTTTMFVTDSSFYSQYVVRLSPLQSSLFLGSMFIVAIPLSFVWSRIALKTANIHGTMLATVLFGLISIAFYFDRTSIAVILTGTCLGVGIAGFLVMMNLLLAEVIDNDARTTGKRREGMYYGMNGFIVRIGMSLQYAIMGIFFWWTGFQSTRPVPTGRTILGFRLLMGGLPLLLLMIAFLFLMMYRHDWKKGGDSRPSASHPNSLILPGPTSPSPVETTSEGV